MRAFRTILSAFLVLLGVMLVVTWAFAVKSVEAVDNGQAAANLTGKALSSPAVVDLVATEVEEQVIASVQDQVDNDLVDLLVGFASEPIHGAVEAFMSSDILSDVAHRGAEQAQTRLVAALTADGRPYGPLTLAVDVSLRINDQLDEVPVVGSFIPEVVVPAVSVDVVPADTFEDVRSAYGVLQWAATWFVWLGLALIAVGVAASPHRRWFLSRAMLVAGVVVLAIGYTVGAMGASQIANLMPGGFEGGLGFVVDVLLSDTAISPIADVLIALGLGALVLSLLAALEVHVFRLSLDRNARGLSGVASGPTHRRTSVSDATRTLDGAKLPLSVPTSIPSSVPTSSSPIPPVAATATTSQPSAGTLGGKKPSAKKPAPRKPAVRDGDA